MCLLNHRKIIKFSKKGLVVSLAIPVLLLGCIWDDSKSLSNSTGRSGDLIVVMDSAMWAGTLGEEARACFQAPLEGLPQSEPHFNLIAVNTNDFQQIFKVTRNIVLIETTNPDSKSEYLFKNDIWAKNQSVLLLKAKSKDEAKRIIQSNCRGIREHFEKEEWKRLQDVYSKLSDASLGQLIETKIGFKPIIPNDFKLAVDNNDLIWLRKDFQHQGHQINMGIIFYKQPYDSVGLLDKKNIIEKRNEIMKSVQGPVENSYMSTYEEFEPVEREINTGKRYIKELRGLWNMKGAFMGGPFVNYSFVDKTGKYIINADIYVFAPKFDKREYLRELEAMALSGFD